MRLLALEFSSSVRSVALLEADQVCAEISVPQGAASRPIPLIDQVLHLADWRRQHIDALALGTGPGSYTGIRLAIAIAQGLHLGTDLPVFAVNSFDVLLLDCPFQVGWLVADAQRQEFAVSKVLRGQRDSNLTLQPLSELQTWLQDGQSVAGPDLPTSLPGHLPLYPQAGNLGRWVARNSPIPIAPEHLHPCYLRPIAFVKAIPPTQ